MIFFYKPYIPIVMNLPLLPCFVAIFGQAWAQDDGTCDAQSGQCTSDPGAPHGGALVVSSASVGRG